MTLEDVRAYEKKMQDETNARMQEDLNKAQDDVVDSCSSDPPSGSVTPQTPAPKKGWFSWS